MQRIKNLYDNKLIIDPDYRGEVIVALHNDTDQIQTIEPGERIGQMILMPLYEVSFEEKEELEDTVRGTGGFGDSGKF